MLARLAAVGAVLIAVAGLGSACTPAPPWMPAGCYDSSSLTGRDFRFDGTEDLAGNATFYLSDDGSCTADEIGVRTIVRAATLDDARTKCATLDPSSSQVYPLNWAGYATAPGDAYGCQ